MSPQRSQRGEVVPDLIVFFCTVLLIVVIFLGIREFVGGGTARNNLTSAISDIEDAKEYVVNEKNPGERLRKLDEAIRLCEEVLSPAEETK